MRAINWVLIAGLLWTGCGGSAGPEEPKASATPAAVQATLNEEEAAVAAWLRENAIQLKTDDPDASAEDLEPLREIVGDARIVMLGEQTHGTHEFYTMRHRMIRFLVQEMGFNVLIVEAPWGPGSAVNDYIHGADLDGWAALEGMQYWTFATTEALDMINWMREYNAGVSESDQIAFYGMDVQSPELSMVNVLAELGQVDAEAAAQAELAYACFSDIASFEALTREAQAACAERAHEIYDLIASRQIEYSSHLSPSDYESLLQEARVVEQGIGTLSDLRNQVRDRAMAENVAWVLAQSGTGSKVIVWAHNAHINLKGGWLGGNLEELYEDEVVAIGTAMYQGSFMASTTVPRDEPGQLIAIEAATAPKGTYEYYLNLVGYEYLLLGLHNADVAEPGAEWLEGPRGFRLNGWAAGRADLQDRSYVLISLPDDFDAVIFIRDTTPSRPLILE